MNYDRAPDPNFLRELSPGGGLAFLVAGGTASGMSLDVHLRRNNHLHVYCGLTRIADVRFGRDGVTVSAHATYADSARALGLFGRRWKAGEYAQLEQVYRRYCARVVVNPRFTEKEGRVQAVLASANDLPWVVLDREAVIGYANIDSQTQGRAIQQVKDAWRKASLEVPIRQGDKTPAELDALCVAPDGTLVLVELKHSSAQASALAAAPLQLLQYLWEWHAALPVVMPTLQKLLNARIAIGLTRPVARLNGRIAGVIGIDCGTIREEVRSRLDKVNTVANTHLPYGVEPIVVHRLPRC